MKPVAGGAVRKVARLAELGHGTSPLFFGVTYVAVLLRLHFGN